MKKYPLIFALLFSLFSICSKGQNRIELPIKDSIIHFEKVVVLEDSLDCQKDILYSKSKTWVSQLFKNPSDVIKVDDKESGRIVVKCLSQLERAAYAGRIESVYCNYNVQIDLKDCKYRIVVNEPTLSSVIPILNPNLSSTYVLFYNNNISPKQLRAMFEGEKAWFQRYDMYYATIKKDSEALIIHYENYIKKDLKKDDW